MLAVDVRIRINNIHRALDESDKTVVRYMEDLVAMLYNKGILDKEDIPDIVIQRFKERKELRRELKELTEFIQSK